MVTFLLETLSRFVIYIISSLGYSGIFICMTIESACIPLPSEIIMPFSGYIVYLGQFNIWLVTLAGSLGNLAGSLIAYAVGYYGGRPFVEKYGKYFLMSKSDLDLSDRWFAKYGDLAVFFSRMLPVVRTFISLPAGIAKMRLPHFIAYSFIGSVPWCYGLAFVGFKLGENWQSIRSYFHQADLLIGVVLVVLFVLWIRRHLKGHGEGKKLEGRR